MKSRYHTEFTGYAGAVDCLATVGGQLFSGKPKDGSHTVVKGKEIYTFWNKNSKNYARCHALALDVSFPHEHFTPGRISKHIIREVVGLKPATGTPDGVFVRLAKDGFHWHYQHVETGYHPYLLEFDLCAAYAASLVRYGSLFFSMSQGEMTDGGLMRNLKVALESVPKWMRLTMLGQIASHKMTFATMPERKNGSFRLQYQTISKIDYGYAFNQVHRAILRLYRVMERIHSIGTHSIKRIHTDSFALSVDCDREVESQIFDYLDDQGFSFSVKGQGSAHFFDLNSGIIGRKFVGVPFEIREQIKALPQKPRRVHITAEQLERWGVRGVLPDRGEGETSRIQEPPVQLELGISINDRTAGFDSRFA